MAKAKSKDLESDSYSPEAMRAAEERHALAYRSIEVLKAQVTRLKSEHDEAAANLNAAIATANEAEVELLDMHRRRALAPPAETGLPG